ncbi:hypothetical protein AAGQ96_03365 [Pantoea sp. MBD-2R]|uniref:hypothetical protein n=1 Tax=Pantoea sp. MBD-2R TaxID=3141540 RepID=UPI0031834E6F
MDWDDLEKHFSSARLGRYRAARSGEKDKAAIDYANNLHLAEAMVPLLNVLEIALRNGIHNRLSLLYQRADWWEAWTNEPAFIWQNKEIVIASTKLLRRHEQQTADKMIAELTFGFWSSLFNTRYQDMLWKDLRLVFAHCPKPQRQRRTISVALNRIRDLRNRIFHHEPLLWLTPLLPIQHATGVAVINWIDPCLNEWLTNHDRLPAVWADSQK